MKNTLTNSAGGRVELGGGSARIAGAGGVQNDGLLTGSGTITKPLTNGTTGKVRVDAGQTIILTAVFAPNAGELNLQAGTLDFSGAVTNSATGFISGRGAIYSAGLTNSGVMAFSGGTADLHGDVTVAAGGARCHQWRQLGDDVLR